MAIQIIGTGSYLGEKVLENKELFSRIQNFDTERAKETVRKKGNDVSNLTNEELFDLWVKQVCGVEKRSFFTEDQRTDNEGPEQLTEYMGYIAAKNAIKDANISPDDIEHVIFSTYTPGRIMPNPACMLSDYLGAKGASAYHMNTACSGFLDAIGTAYMMIKSGEYKRIIVIAADLMSHYIDFSDVTTAILFGDGAAACIIERNEESDGGILSYASMTNYSNEMLSMDYGKNIKMGGGPLVQRNAVNAMSSSLQKALEKANLSVENINYLLPHQANLRIIHRLADKMKIPYENTLTSVSFTGNTSAASIGIGMDYAMKNKFDNLKFKNGDILGLTTVGGGYSFAGLIYKI